jgi:hypothetical protein
MDAYEKQCDADGSTEVFNNPETLLDAFHNTSSNYSMYDTDIVSIHE